MEPPYFEETSIEETRAPKRVLPTRGGKAAAWRVERLLKSERPSAAGAVVYRSTSEVR